MSNLRVYLLELKRERFFTEYERIAVIAENEEDARKVAAEYGKHFLDEDETSCEEVPFKRGVILAEAAPDR